MQNHENIFALGDVADLPIQNSAFGNFHQTRVMVHNALDILKSNSIEGKYNLQTKLPLYTGVAKMNFYSSEAGVENIGGQNLIMDILRYYQFGKFGAKKNFNTYMGKNTGVSKVYNLMNGLKKGQPNGKDPLFVADH